TVSPSARAPARSSMSSRTWHPLRQLLHRAPHGLARRFRRGALPDEGKLVVVEPELDPPDDEDALFLGERCERRLVVASALAVHRRVERSRLIAGQVEEPLFQLSRRPA